MWLKPGDWHAAKAGQEPRKRDSRRIEIQKVAERSLRVRASVVFVSDERGEAVRRMRSSARMMPEIRAGCPSA